MSNTSATGGFLIPASSQALPGSLSLEDFIQTMIVGISGYAGNLVRPKWQQAPPKQPDININWIAFGINISAVDANAFVGVNDGGSTTLKRQEKVQIQLSFFGPNALENFSIFRDGFQIQQNLEALTLADMGYNGITDALRGPDLFNERWVERYESTLTLVRQVRRDYSVLTFASASGSIHTVLEEELTINWEAPAP